MKTAIFTALTIATSAQAMCISGGTDSYSQQKFYECLNNERYQSQQLQMQREQLQLQRQQLQMQRPPVIQPFQSPGLITQRPNSVYEGFVQGQQLRLQMEMQEEQIRSIRMQAEQADAQRRYMEEQQAEERRRRQADAARTQQPQSNNQPDPVIDEWLKAAAPRMGLYPDFEKVVFAADVPITTDMIRLMTPSPLAADIAYYLGKNKVESLAISKMTLVDAARSIDRIEGKLKRSKLP